MGADDERKVRALKGWPSFVPSLGITVPAPSQPDPVAPPPRRLATPLPDPTPAPPPSTALGLELEPLTEAEYDAIVLGSPPPSTDPAAVPPPEPDASPAEAPAPSSVSEPLPEHGITLYVARIPYGGAALSHQVTLPTPDPTMSTSDLVSVLSASVPAALQLHKVQLDGDAIEGIIEVVSDIAKRAARYAKRDKLTSHRDNLHRDACDEISCVAPSLAAPVIERIGEIVIDVIDEHTDTGPIDGVDGEVAKRGLAALAERVEDWLANLGNLQARAQRARERAARQISKAERLEELAKLKS